MIPLEEGIEIILKFNEISDIRLTAKEAEIMWQQMSEKDKDSAIDAFHTLKKHSTDDTPTIPKSFIGLGCAIQVNVDARGWIWVTGHIVKKLKHVQTPQYAVSCDDRLYYVDADKVYINTADLKTIVEKVVGDIL